MRNSVHRAEAAVRMRIQTTATPRGFELLQYLPMANKPNTLMNPAPTARQGQFLAYIYQYSLVNGCAPAEADMQRYFQITPPSVHSMVLTLERRGFIRRVPGQARSITLTVPPESLPPLQRVQR